MIKIVLLIPIIIFSSFGFSQSDSTQQFDLSLEFRPRFEYRDGYKQLPADTLKPAFFTSSRTRLLLDFNRKQSAFHFSAEDVRIWGQNGQAPATGSFHIFEAYAKFQLKLNWKIKLGRQFVELDNGRLFSRSNWSQASRAHEGFRLSYQRKKITSEIMGFYNQNKTNVFSTNYNLNFYKYLVNHFFIYSISDNWELKTLNTFDGYQSAISQNTVYVRGTSGGRISYKSKKFTATFAGYYQYGQLVSGQLINAFYLQPELKFKIKKLNIRAGMEYLTGDDNTAITIKSRSFSTLYGVSFKFMGHLNYFTSFPKDVNGSGLLNPYLFFSYKLSKKIRFKIESHLFYTQNNMLNTNNEIVNRYLGFESDFKLKYEINKETFFDFGFSLMSPSISMATIKTGDYTKTPIFSFLMFTWKPTLFSIEQPIQQQ